MESVERYTKTHTIIKEEAQLSKAQHAKALLTKPNWRRELSKLIPKVPKPQSKTDPFLKAWLRGLDKVDSYPKFCGEVVADAPPEKVEDGYESDKTWQGYSDQEGLGKFDTKPRHRAQPKRRRRKSANK